MKKLLVAIVLLLSTLYLFSQSKEAGTDRAAIKKYVRNKDTLPSFLQRGEIEAVCANKTTLGKVGNTCNGYINKIQIPKLGEHVKETGGLVIDSHNGWEIRPITKIEIIK